MQKTNTILINPKMVPTTLEIRIAEAKAPSHAPFMEEAWQKTIKQNYIRAALHEYSLWKKVEASPLPNLSKDSVFGKYFMENGELGGEGEKILAHGSGADMRARNELEAGYFMMMARRTGIAQGIREMIARTVVDTKSFGCDFLDFKLKILERAAKSKAKGGKVLYPSCCDDIAHALLLPSDHYALIDPFYSDAKNPARALENWASIIMTYASREQEWFEIGMEQENGSSSAEVRLAKERMTFSLHPREFDAVNENESNVFAIIVKKPTGSMHKSLEGDGLAALAGMIAQGGFFLYSDWGGNLERVEAEATKHGLAAVERGELNCERVLAGGDIDEYPAVLFEKK